MLEGLALPFLIPLRSEWSIGLLLTASRQQAFPIGLIPDDVNLLKFVFAMSLGVFTFCLVESGIPLKRLFYYSQRGYLVIP